MEVERRSIGVGEEEEEGGGKLRNEEGGGMEEEWGGKRGGGWRWERRKREVEWRRNGVGKQGRREVGKEEGSPVYSNMISTYLARDKGRGGKKRREVEKEGDGPCFLEEKSCWGFGGWCSFENISY
jgi:hypothetical protein